MIKPSRIAFNGALTLLALFGLSAQVAEKPNIICILADSPAESRE